VKTGMGSATAGSQIGKGPKIAVPIPVHADRFAVRSQHQRLEKCPSLLLLGGH